MLGAAERSPFRKRDFCDLSNGTQASPGNANKLQRIDPCAQLGDPTGHAAGKENATPGEPGVQQILRHSSASSPLKQQGNLEFCRQLQFRSSQATFSGRILSSKAPESGTAIQDRSEGDIEPREGSAAGQEVFEQRTNNSIRRIPADQGQRPTPLEEAFQALPPSRSKCQRSTEAEEGSPNNAKAMFSQDFDTQLREFDLPLSDAAFQETEELQGVPSHGPYSSLPVSVRRSAPSPANGEVVASLDGARSEGDKQENNVTGSQGTAELQRSAQGGVRPDPEGQALEDSLAADDWDLPDDFDEDIPADLTQAQQSNQQHGRSSQQAGSGAAAKVAGEEFDSDLEAELDAFLDDMELQPPSEDEAGDEAAPEARSPSPDHKRLATVDAVGFQARCSTSPESSPQSPEKGPAMHSWLIRSPEPEPAPLRSSTRLVYQPKESNERIFQHGSGADVSEGRTVPLPRRNEDDISGMAIAITSSEGDQVYCSLEDGIPRRRKSKKPSKPLGQLLSAPIDVLIDEVDQDAYLRAVAASTATPGSAQKVRPASADAGRTQKEQLWVDKYSPKSFLDLLSDEVINKEVVKWLKSWDSQVWGRAREGHKSMRGGKLKPVVTGPPEQKILLMSGAPGLGKTTLAHVVARHCGYRPVEINASDDRTGSALQTRITDATHMQPVMGAKQPNCVIIDEIDGAAGGSEGKSAVAALLKLINGAPGAAVPQAREPQESRQKKRKGAQPLNRPLIAICNDLYAPVLRPLRAVAKLISFKAPQTAKLVLRLQMICAKEKVAVDRQALSMLAEKTENDTRACLNTLQFLSKQHAKIKVNDVARLSIGQKDMTKGVFSLWNQLLCSKTVAKHNVRAETEQLHRALGDFGDYELVLNGVHHNMLLRRFLDTTMSLTCRVFDQLHAADSLITAVKHNMDFSLHAYVPATMLGIRAAVASPDRSRLEWPKAAMEQSGQLASNRALLQSWLSGMSAQIRATLQPSFLAQEQLPTLVKVLCHPIRAVARSLLNEMEKRAISSIVATLIAYNLEFDIAALDPESDSPSLILKPEIHLLCRFERFPRPQASLPIAVQQMLTHEVQLERVKLKALKDGQPETRTLAEQPHGVPVTEAQDVKDQSQRPPSAGTKLMLSVAERAQQAGKGSVKQTARKSNWLEQVRESKQKRRPSVMAPAAQQNSQASGHQVKSGLSALYKYKEGFTNAVKRPLRMKDLL